VPIVKVKIEGQEYGFAPLTWKQLDELPEAINDPRGVIKHWFPLIEDSAKRAGNNAPNFVDLDMDRFNIAFPLVVDAIKKASGIVSASPGEAGPVAA
jgi:hypothetical protein